MFSSPKWTKAFKKNESGSFTIEASMIFPIIILTTIVLLFFTLVIYQKAVLHQRAQLIADRMAYVWNNSDKDSVTGDFDTYASDSDGLYWRLFNNKLLSKFGLSLGGGCALCSQKFGRIKDDSIPAGAEMTHSFDSKLVGGEVTITLTAPLSLPDFATNLFGIKQAKTTATASFDDPVEFIRNTDLVVHYGEQLMEMMQSESTPTRAVKIFKK